jgi:hypothetical protein
MIRAARVDGFAIKVRFAPGLFVLDFFRFGTSGWAAICACLIARLHGAGSFEAFPGVVDGRRVTPIKVKFHAPNWTPACAGEQGTRSRSRLSLAWPE